MAVAIELVNIRLALKAYTTDLVLPSYKPIETKPLSDNKHRLYGFEKALPVFDRQTLSAGQCIDGPALITEQVSTTLVASGWQLQVDPFGNLLLEKL